VTKSNRIRELEDEIAHLEEKLHYYQTNYECIKERLEMVKDAWSIAHPIDVAYMRRLSDERLRICCEDHFDSDASQEIMKHPDFYTQLMNEWGRPLPNGKVARRGRSSFELAETYRRKRLEAYIEQMHKKDEQEATDESRTCRMQ
jgi:hypothetical protein